MPVLRTCNFRCTVFSRSHVVVFFMLHYLSFTHAYENGWSELYNGKLVWKSRFIHLQIFSLLLSHSLSVKQIWKSKSFTEEKHSFLISARNSADVGLTFLLTNETIQRPIFIFDQKFNSFCKVLNFWSIVDFDFWKISFTKLFNLEI